MRSDEISLSSHDESHMRFRGKNSEDEDTVENENIKI